MNYTDFICICQAPTTHDISTILSVLGILIPLVISEILALSNCEANGLIDGCIKLCNITKQRVIAPRGG